MNPKQQHALDLIRAEANAENYKVLGNYQNSRSRLLFRCPVGHTYIVQAQTWTSGSRCHQCSVIRRANRLALTVEQVDQRLSLDGYKRLSDYVSYRDSLKVECPNLHQWRTTAKNFTLGHRCPTCKKETDNSESLNT